MELRESEREKFMSRDMASFGLSNAVSRGVKIKRGRDANEKERERYKGKYE